MGFLRLTNATKNDSTAFEHVTVNEGRQPMAKKQKPVVVRVPTPETLNGQLKRMGGSSNDDFNAIVLSQAMSALWLAHSDEEARDKQRLAAATAMIGLKPQDELEGMLAAQAVAVHNAAMECYRRAMIPEQTFEGRRENLNQANKLSRSYAVLVESLDRHRGKGQQVAALVAVLLLSGQHAVARNSGSHSSSRGSGYTNPSVHSVRPYVTKKGTYVQGHKQTNPNGTKRDNFSTKGNVNPYTGKAGTKNP